MSEKEKANYGVGGIIGLIIVIGLGVWGYNTFFKNYDKPWYQGVQAVQACTSLNGGCISARAVSTGDEITNIYTSDDPSQSGYFQSKCSKDDIGRFCMGELRNGTFLYIRE